MTTHNAGQTALSFPPGWLRRFLLGLAATAGTVALILWLYSLWGWVAVVQNSHEALARGDDDGLKQAVVVLESPHIFAAYEAYHGFGTEKAEARAAHIAGIVARGSAYTEDELALLVQQIAYYIPAFLEHKERGSVQILPGDRAIIESLLARWENALHSGIALAIHASLVTLLFTILFVAYLKLGHFQRFEQPPPAGQ